MSFSCVLCVDFDTDAHTKGGGGGRRLEDEKRLFVVVLLVGVETTTMLLVAAANILKSRCVRVKVWFKANTNNIASKHS